MSHSTRVYTTKEQYLADSVDSESARRHRIIHWKNHVAKHGNAPMIEKCKVCSGQEFKTDIKKGRYKVSKEKHQNYLLEQE